MRMFKPMLLSFLLSLFMLVSTVDEAEASITPADEMTCMTDVGPVDDVPEAWVLIYTGPSGEGVIWGCWESPGMSDWVHGHTVKMEPGDSVNDLSFSCSSPDAEGLIGPVHDCNGGADRCARVYYRLDLEGGGNEQSESCALKDGETVLYTQALDATCEE